MLLCVNMLNAIGLVGCRVATPNSLSQSETAHRSDTYYSVWKAAPMNQADSSIRYSNPCN